MLNPEKPTEDIVRDFRDGKDRTENFELLYRRYYRNVSGFFLRKGFLLADAQDLTQLVFLSIYKNLTTVRDEYQFEGWMTAICRSVFRTEMERKYAQRRSAPGPVVDLSSLAGEGKEVAAGSASPLEQVLDQEKRRALTDALQQLPPQMRRCAVLRWKDELEYEVIAAQLDISIDAVKAHLFKAKKTLTKILGQRFDDIAD